MGTTKVSTGTTAMSETTMKNSALRLQRVSTMKSTIVGLLAVVTLAGCGVGMDDPEGQQAAAGSSQATLLVKTPSDQPELVKRLTTDPQALPQDPIPLFDARTAPNVPPSDPISDTRPFK